MSTWLGWLLVHDVGGLERKLIGLVVTVLSLVFLGQIMSARAAGACGVRGRDRCRHRRLDPLPPLDKEIERRTDAYTRAKDVTLLQRPT